MPETLLIKGFIETSFVDWPGKVAAVVFLPRCNFRCPYCHNHQLVLAPEAYASHPLPFVLEKLDSMRDWIDGVCITGGEPTIHAELPAFARTFVEAGWKVKLDTNGSNPGMVCALLREKLLAGVSLDVKAPLEPIPYRRNGGPGAKPEPVEETLRILATGGVPLEVRVTVHPDLLRFDELERLIRQVWTLAGTHVPIKLQACRTEQVLDEALAGSATIDQKELDAWFRNRMEALIRESEGALTA